MHPIFKKRYSHLLSYIREDDVILDIGTVHRNLRELLGKDHPCQIITCDPLLPSTTHHPDGDISLRGSVSELPDLLQKLNLRPSICIILGMNPINTKENPAVQIHHMITLVQLLNQCRLSMIEFPIRSWAARLEGEIILSLMRPKLYLDYQEDYSLEPSIPVHAALRRQLIFTPNKIPSEDEVRSLFSRIFFGAFEIPENIEKFTPSHTYRSMQKFKGCTLFPVLRQTLMSGIGQAWNYAAHIPNLSLSPLCYKMHFRGFYNKLSVSKMENNKIYLERRLANINCNPLYMYLNPNQSILFRLHSQPGAYCFLLKIEIAEIKD